MLSYVFLTQYQLIGFSAEQIKVKAVQKVPNSSRCDEMWWIVNVRPARFIRKSQLNKIQNHASKKSAIIIEKKIKVYNIYNMW